jgi:hypothetical protein
VGAIVAIAALTLSGAAGLPGASGATSPKLVVTPSANLKNGEVVKVTGSGFKAKDVVFLVECLVKAKGQSQCNSAGATPVTVSVKGLLPPTKFRVKSGAIGNGKCGTIKSNLKSCDISAGNISGGDSAAAVITFRRKG